MSMVRFIAATVLAASVGFAQAAKGEVTIGPGGGWSVVWSDVGAKGVTQANREIAAVTADVLKEAVDAEVKVIKGQPTETTPGKRIFIGASFAEAAGLMPNDFTGYDYACAERNGDIYLFGRDRGGAHPDRTSGSVTPSALAAVRFLERHAGALFLMPGKIGREVPKRAAITIPEGLFERGGVHAAYQSGRAYDLAYNLANNIYGAGAFHTYGGHTYPVACPRAKYFKTNPEYFAMNKEGKRAWGTSDGCQGYCISNPEFQKMVYDELLKRYDAGADVCQLGQNDGGAVCHCAACKDFYGAENDWGEKIWLYHADIAKRIQKDRPGKLVHIMCYGATATPPKTFKKFPGNVLIEVCSYGEADMRKWDGYEVPHGFTYYIYNWSWYPVPGFTPKRSIAGLVEQLARFERYGMKGIYRCGFGEMFGMEGPAYWVYNRLVGDPKADVAAELARYYAQAFGDAAAPMRRFYEALEEPLARVEKATSLKASDLVEESIRVNRARDPITVLSSVYTPERVALMDAALAEAEGTAGLSEKRRRRLALVRKEWDYVRNVGTIASVFARFRAAPEKADFDRLADLIAERNAMIAKLYAKGTMERVEGWPEVALFGNPPEEQFRSNGRLGATLKVPLNWDVARMRKYGIMPGIRMSPEERRAECEKAGVKPLAGFRVIGKLSDGAFYEPTADGTGFKFGCGTNVHVRVGKRLSVKEGTLVPGKTYRISWLTRWEHVNARHSWNGYYFCCGEKNDGSYVQEPDGRLLDGDSNGWIRGCIAFTVPEKPDYATDCIFRFWHGNTGVAEVRDLTIEQLAD